MLSFGAESFALQFAFQNIKIKVCRTLILPFVLYGSETWSLTFREEKRLRVFENRVLRRIFGPKRDEVTGEWSKSYVELNDLHPSPNIIRVTKWRRMRWARHEARMGEDSCVPGFGGKPEGKRGLVRPRRRWEDNVKKGLQEVGCEGMNLVDLTQDRERWRALVNAVMKFRVP